MDLQTGDDVAIKLLRRSTLHVNAVTRCMEPFAPFSALVCAGILQPVRQQNECCMLSSGAAPLPCKIAMQ